MWLFFLPRESSEWAGPPPPPAPRALPNTPFFNSYISSMWQNAATSSSLSSETSNNSWPLETAWGREPTFKRRAADSVPFASGHFPSSGLLPDLHPETLGIKALEALNTQGPRKMWEIQEALYRLS